MCLFPVSCLINSLNYGAILTFLCSLLSIGFAVWALIKSNSTNYTDLFYDQAQLYKNIIQISLFVFGGVLFFISIFGICGAKRRSGFCLCLFQIGAVIMCLLFLAFGITSQTISVKLLNGGCSSNQWSNNIDETAQLSQLIFCKPNCQCYVDKTKFKDQSTIAQLNTTSDPNDPIQFQQCSIYEQQLSPISAFLAAGENLFECAGWCDASKYYLFTDINRGDTQGESCYGYLKSFFQKNGMKLAYIFYAVGAYLLLLVLLALCLCCTPGNKEIRKDFYNRMKVYDD